MKASSWAGVPIFVEHWGDNLQFYPIFSIGGMSLDHDFVQVSKLREDQKKKLFTKNGTLFSPNLNGDLCSDADHSQNIGRDADVDHTQIIGGDTVKLLGDTVKLLGGYIPPSPPNFGTLGLGKFYSSTAGTTSIRFTTEQGYSFAETFLSKIFFVYFSKKNFFHFSASVKKWLYKIKF